MDTNYDTRVCGQVPTLASTLRELIKMNDKDSMEDILNKIKIQIKTVQTDKNIRVQVGQMKMLQDGAPVAIIGSSGAEIDISLIIDPLDIDSKMVTSINYSVPSPQRESIFKCLYKYNPL